LLKTHAVADDGYVEMHKAWFLFNAAYAQGRFKPDFAPLGENEGLRIHFPTLTYKN